LVRRQIRLAHPSTGHRIELRRLDERQFMEIAAEVRVRVEAHVSNRTQHGHRVRSERIGELTNAQQNKIARAVEDRTD
jgi:hypothetical protein